jgi:hypothetical protein
MLYKWLQWKVVPELYRPVNEVGTNDRLFSDKVFDKSI